MDRRGESTTISGDTRNIDQVLGQNSAKWKYSKPLCIKFHQNIGKLHIHEHFFAKGVLHPCPILWLFIQFSQELQHINDK